MQEEFNKIKKLNDGLSVMLDQHELYKLRGTIESSIFEALKEATSAGLDDSISTGEYRAMQHALSIAYRHITTDHKFIFETKVGKVEERPF